MKHWPWILNYKGSLISITLPHHQLTVDLYYNTLPSSEHHELHALLGGVSNVAYVCVCVCCIIWEGVCFAAQAFLKDINSVNLGNTYVLKSPFCCAHWPRSKASEGLWCRDKWLHCASLLVHLSNFNFFFISTQNEKLPPAWGQRGMNIWCHYLYIFLFGGYCLLWYLLKYIGQKEGGGGGSHLAYFHFYRHNTLPWFWFLDKVL